MRFPLMISVFLTLTTSCSHPRPHEDPTIWRKVQINLRELDTEGLAGKPGAKVAVNYEFCIPAQADYWKMVSRIDRTAQNMTVGKGRVGCTKDQWLIIGSTHQKNYMRVLYDLAALPYVQRIQQTFWE